MDNFGAVGAEAWEQFGKRAAGVFDGAKSVCLAELIVIVRDLMKSHVLVCMERSQGRVDLRNSVSLSAWRTSEGPARPHPLQV